MPSNNESALFVQADTRALLTLLLLVITGEEELKPTLIFGSRSNDRKAILMMEKDNRETNKAKYLWLFVVLGLGLVSGVFLVVE